MTIRVGVISDTHCPEFLDRLPMERLRSVFAGCELILHAGDVNAESTLEQLATIAPVQAVRGDHDHALSGLPLSREVVVDGKRVVITHGNRSRWIEEPQTLLWTLSLGYFRPHRSLPRALSRRHPEADVIVYGHVHSARGLRVGGTLVFNPGAVHQWNPATVRHRLTQKPGWFEWCWLQVARHMRRYAQPSVGLLEFNAAGVTHSIIEL